VSFHVHSSESAWLESGAKASTYASTPRVSDLLLTLGRRDAFLTSSRRYPPLRSSKPFGQLEGGVDCRQRLFSRLALLGLKRPPHSAWFRSGVTARDAFAWRPFFSPVSSTGAIVRSWRAVEIRILLGPDRAAKVLVVSPNGRTEPLVAIVVQRAAVQMPEADPWARSIVIEALRTKMT
jgi:hypothetical protein